MFNSLPWSGSGAWSGNGPWKSNLEEEITGGPFDDYFAVISLGTFPKPTPTDSERAYYAVTFGLRHIL